MNGSSEPVEAMTLTRSSPDDMVVSQSMESNLSPSTIYVAEAVGLVNEEPIDTLNMTTTFTVMDDSNCTGEKECIYLNDIPPNVV